MDSVDGRGGELHYADFGRPIRLLGKEELGNRLGFSVRWVEERMAEGMPSQLKGRRRVFREIDCRNWSSQNGIVVRKQMEED